MTTVSFGHNQGAPLKSSDDGSSSGASLSSKTIFRVAGPNRAFTQISNTLLADKDISFACKGFLVSILMLPVDWLFRIPWLCEQYGVKRDKAYQLVKEAIEKKYCKRIVVRDDSGRAVVTEYHFSDDPAAWTAPKTPLPEKPEVAQNTTSGFTRSGSARSGQGRRIQKKHFKKDSTSTKSLSRTDCTSDNPPLFERDAGERLIPFDAMGVENLLESAVLEKARSCCGVDRLPFTPHALRQVSSMCIDVSVLVLRYLDRTKGRTIKDPSAYLVKMARDAVAKRDGVFAAEIERVHASSRAVRVKAAAKEPRKPPAAPAAGAVQVNEALSRMTISRGRAAETEA